MQEATIKYLISQLKFDRGARNRPHLPRLLAAEWLKAVALAPYPFLCGCKARLDRCERIWAEAGPHQRDTEHLASRGPDSCDSASCLRRETRRRGPSFWARAGPSDPRRSLPTSRGA